MLPQFNSLLRLIAARLPIAKVEQLYGHALHGQNFGPALAGALLLQRREDVWADMVTRVGENTKILYTAV